MKNIIPVTSFISSLIRDAYYLLNTFAFFLLATHAGRVLTHRQILTRIWGPAHVEDVAYLRVFIGQLRQKIEENPAEPALIVTEPGVGYRAHQPPEG